MFSRTASYASSSSSAASRRSDRVSAHPQVDSPLLSPTVSLSSSLPEVPPTPATKQKQKRPVHASSRGGLGNIRARKQALADIAKDTASVTTTTSPTSPSIKSSSSSSSTSPSSFRFRRVLSVGSNSTHSTMSSGSSVYSNVDSIAATFGSNGSGAASVISGVSGSRVSGSGVGGDHDEYDVSEPGSPLSPSFASQQQSPSGKGKGKTKAIVSTSAEYALHLQTDARHRALGKQNAKAREKEKEAELGNGLDDGETNPEEKVVKLRSSRGGAGVYKAVEFGVDPTLHPHAATITQAYEARAAAHTREIIAASRMRSALKGSTGRGGAGNVGAGGKRVKSQVKRSRKNREADKGKGKAREDAVMGEGNGTSVDGASALEEVGDDDATVVHEDDAPDGEGSKDRKKSPRFRKLFRRAVRANGNQVELNPISPPPNDNTPRPSMGDSVLEIRRPASPSPSFPSVASSTSLCSPPPISSPSVAYYGVQGTSKLRKQQRSRDELREGAELLAFVNAALPDLPGARNVLGVPGTPGFPLPGGNLASGANGGLQRSYTVTSSRSSTPVNHYASANSNDLDVHRGIPVESVQSGPMNADESTEEEEWVDDDTLRDVDEDDNSDEEEEDEDSDIDPQMLPRPSRKEQQYALPKYDYGKHDSLDAVIRVALDKLDRAEITAKEDSDDGGIDPYAYSNDASHYNGSHPQAPPFQLSNPTPRRIPPASPPPLAPVPLALPPTRRYVRATAPVPPSHNPWADSHPTQKIIGGGAVTGGKHRTSVPCAGPPPTRPVPRLPDQY